VISAELETVQRPPERQLGPSRKPEGDPAWILLLEAFLIIYAVYASQSLSTYTWLASGITFGREWDSIEVWLYRLIDAGSAIGVLGYLLYSRWRNMGTSSQNSLWNFIEVVIVSWVGYGLFVIQSLHLLVEGVTVGDFAPGVSWEQEFFGILRDFNGLAFLAYVLYRNSRRFADLGLRWTAGGAAMCLPLIIAGNVIHSLLTSFVFWGAESLSFAPVTTPYVGEYFFHNGITFTSVFSLIVNGFSEELLVRAYLMVAITRLTRSTVLAIIISVAVQTSYHFYQGRL
jgi:hypothetical protein